MQHIEHKRTTKNTHDNTSQAIEQTRTNQNKWNKHDKSQQIGALENGFQMFEQVRTMLNHIRTKKVKSNNQDKQKQTEEIGQLWTIEKHEHIAQIRTF